MNDLIEIKKRIEASFIASMANYLRLRERARNGNIYVTDLTEKCMRKIFWDITKPDGRIYDEKDIISLGIGTLTHTLPLSDIHEVRLRYRNVVGRVDDIIANSNNVIIVDKKTCASIPQEIKEQHANQVRYYAVLLEYGEQEKDGQWVQSEHKGQRYIGVILYIDVSNGKTEAKVMPIDTGQAKMELDQKIDLIVKAMSENMVPPSVYGWWCSYCPWYLECRLLDGQDLSKVQSIPV